MRKVQLFGTVLERKGEQLGREENCEQQNSLEQRINLIENMVVKVSSDIISLRRVVDDNNNKLNVLNANVNSLIKHLVGNENANFNKDTSTTCGTPYDVHPSKSIQKKEASYKFQKANEMFEDERPNFKKKQHL